LRFAPVPLTRQEIAALAWAVKESRSRQPFQAALSTALPKLQTFAAPRDGRLAAAFDGAVAGWDRGIKDYAVLGPEVLRLLEAIVSRRRCHLEYASPGRPRERRFPYDPYRVLAVQGGLYCVGKVPAYENFVTLAVNRIRSLEVAEESFTVDPAFDPQALRGRSVRRGVGEADDGGRALRRGPGALRARAAVAPEPAGARAGGRPDGADVPGGRDVRDHALGAELEGCGGGGTAAGVTPGDCVGASKRQRDLPAARGDKGPSRECGVAQESIVVDPRRRV
jgi:hypothetical protein